jgi:tRNA nucleotidyltransferase (CCA-adding enzyme)
MTDKPVSTFVLNQCITDNLLMLRNLFKQKGFDIRIVGGAVRDVAKNVIPKDVDLCTDAFPDEAIQIYKDNGIRFEPTGIDHGTITVVFGDEVYEITSLRFDTETDGRHAKVTFTRDWHEDLARRDLTINAMAIDFDGNIYDPFDGYNDLKNGIVKFVGDPEERIQEDYLRILRYFRFAGRYAANIRDTESFDAIKKHAHGLKNISRERVWQEVKKIMSASSYFIVYQDMATAGVLEYSDLPPLDEVSFVTFQKCRTSIDVIHRLPSFINGAVVLSALMKDAKEVEAYGRKLKMSTDDMKLMKLAFELRQQRELYGIDRSIKFMSSLYYLKGVSKDSLYEASKAVSNMMVSVARGLDDQIVFPVSGDDLIAKGFKPGKQLGDVINKLKQMWFDEFHDNESQMSRDELINYAVKLKV